MAGLCHFSSKVPNLQDFPVDPLQHEADEEQETGCGITSAARVRDAATNRGIIHTQLLVPLPPDDHDALQGFSF